MDRDIFKDVMEFYYFENILTKYIFQKDNDLKHTYIKISKKSGCSWNASMSCFVPDFNPVENLLKANINFSRVRYKFGNWFIIKFY